MAIVLPSFDCTMKSNHPAASAFYPIFPVINDGEGSVMLLEARRGSSDGTSGTITFTVNYDDDFSNQRLLYISHTNVAVGNSVSSELKLTGIDFSKSNIRCITAKTNQVDVIPSEFTMAIWKPEIILNSFHAYRSDGSKNASTTGQYVTIEGNVSFDLPNLEAITNIGGTLMPTPLEDFSPVGQYRFKITDKESTIYSDYSYITNLGTLESYQNAKNGIEFSEVINCSTVNLDSAAISIETEIVSEIGGTVGYEGDGAEVLLNKNVYFHMSPNGRGIGIGGIPMHGNYETPALDIHWPVHFHGQTTIQGKSIIDYIYPIGSIYLNVNDVSPGILFGGTWEKIEGRFLLGSSSSYVLGGTGGAATVALTTAQMPSHTHTFTGTAASHNHTGYWHAGKNRAAVGTSRDVCVSASYSTTKNVQYSQATSSKSITPAGKNSNTGSGSAHNNMPPYLTVNIWKRIA